MQVNVKDVSQVTLTMDTKESDALRAAVELAGLRLKELEAMGVSARVGVPFCQDVAHKLAAAAMNKDIDRTDLSQG